MAFKPSIEIDGIVYKGILEISYEIRTAIDETGRPSDKSRAGLIKVLRTSDDRTDIAKWAAGRKDASAEWRSGKITLTYYSGTETKEIAFEKAFVSRYQEKIARKGEYMLPVEYFEISCGKIEIAADKFSLDNRWEENDSP